MHPPRYIAVEGVIGVGKTTLTRRLAERLGGRTVHEPVVENPFLARFYEDRARFAFQTQLFFLLTRYQQQAELRQGDLFAPVVVCDYLFAKDQIFASLNLSDEELALYQQVYRLLDRQALRPDMVVYLRAGTDVLLERIRRRGLPFEQDIPEAYLTHLSDLYNRFFASYDESPLLVVPAAEFDFVSQGSHVDLLLHALQEHPGGTAFLPPPGSYDRDG